MQVWRVSDPRAVPRARTRLPSTSGDSWPPGRYVSTRPSRPRPLPPSGAGRGRPYVGHGFRAANPQDSREPHDAEDRGAADPHVLRHLPEADPGARAGLPAQLRLPRGRTRRFHFREYHAEGKVYSY